MQVVTNLTDNIFKSLFGLVDVIWPGWIGQPQRHLAVILRITPIATNYNPLKQYASILKSYRGTCTIFKHNHNIQKQKTLMKGLHVTLTRFGASLCNTNIHIGPYFTSNKFQKHYIWLLKHFLICNHNNSPRINSLL